MQLKRQRTSLGNSALIMMLFLFSGCLTDDAIDDVSVDSSPAAVIPAEQFFDYRLIESDSGIKQWILQSDEMQRFSGQRDVVLINVHMDFFKNAEHFSVLTADSGRADLESKNVHTWGNVLVITDDGRRLETEDLYFNNKTELIHNDVFNRFTRGTDVMTGIGLEATPDLEYIELREDVKAEVVDATSSTPKGNSESQSESPAN